MTSELDRTEPRAPSGLIARYRAWYEKMPTGMQMIGLQVWLPVFFVVAFVFCYIAAFHAPAPHDVPVGIVGASAQAQPIAEGLAKSGHGVFDASVVSTVGSARELVRSSSLAAAFVPGDGTATIIVAGANGYQMSALAQQMLAPLAASLHDTVKVDDIAPLPSSDSFGTTLFYLSLVWTISGYMMAMFVGMMGAGLKHYQRFSIFGASSVLLTGLATLLVRFALQAVHGHFFELWAIGAATSFAIGCVVNGFAYYVGRFVTAYALLFFVFANVPSSGGAYPPELVPQPFAWLHNIVSGTATVELARRAEYGVGPDAWHGWLTLAVYAAIGLVLAFTGKPFLRWKNARRKARGARPNMMVTAQAASLIHAGFVAPLAKAKPTRPHRPEQPEPQETASAPAARVAQQDERADAGVHGRHAAAVDDEVIKAETQALEILEDDARRDIQIGAEEAEADAIAAETGAAG
jgi:hypothetical protein